MNKYDFYLKIVLVLVSLWVGFVCAISFMEAWLKFRVPTVTLEIGLAIGRKVFYALNKVEWGISLVIVFVLIKNKFLLSGYGKMILIPLLILILQTWYLFPILDKRAELIAQNIHLDKSYMHLVYVVLEVIKVAFLIGIGIQIIRNNEN